MMSNLWCTTHKKMARGTPETGVLDERLFAARALEQFRELPAVRRAVSTDPIYPDDPAAEVLMVRLLGVLTLTPCVCCDLGNEVVRAIAAASVKPGRGKAEPKSAEPAEPAPTDELPSNEQPPQ